MERSTSLRFSSSSSYVRCSPSEVKAFAEEESMTTKELINTEIEKLSEDELKKVYGVVKSLAESKSGETKLSFMSRLKRIQIEAPEDFAANLDLYVSGEKRVQ